MSQLKSGIYRIRNNHNGKIYIGQSQDVYKRIEQHKAELKAGKHKNKKMQEDYNKNPDSFVFEIVEFCYWSELNNKEKEWIDKYYGDNCYNLTRGGARKTRKKDGRIIDLLDELT